MSTRSWYMRIEDILEAISAIEEYTAGMDFSSWEKDRKTIDAVIRNFELIGEAATHVPDEVQERFSEVPWAKMKGIKGACPPCPRKAAKTRSVQSQNPESVAFC